MSKVIDFKTPGQLRDELAQSFAENTELKAQVANLSAVKELLTMQVLDLREQMAGHIVQMQAIQTNLDNLLAKLSG